MQDKIKENIDKAYAAIKSMESIADTQEEKEKINEYKEMIDKTEKLISTLYKKQETKKPKKKRFELVLDCSDELKDIILEYISSLKGMQDEEIVCTEVKDYKTMDELKKLHTPKFNTEDHKLEFDDKLNSLNFTININDLDVNERLEDKSVADKIIYDGRTYKLVQQDDNYYYYEHNDVKQSLKNFLKEFEHIDKILYNTIKDKLIKHCGNKLVL